jgi:hypothetical protein
MNEKRASKVSVDRMEARGEELAKTRGENQFFLPSSPFPHPLLLFYL